MTAVALMVFGAVFGQEKDVDMSIYGWVRGDLIYDSRECAAPFDRQLLLYPLAPSLDPAGEDINASGSLSPSMLVTRLGVNLAGPEILNGKSSARIETDFAGSDSYGLLRVRHAWAKLAWDNSSLLVGQTWHLMFTEHCFPTVISVNTGLPFQPFARNPQIRYTQNMGKSVTLLTSAAMQTSYRSLGPDGSSNIYARRSSIPNMHAQLQYRTGTFLLGGGYDFKALKPKISTVGSDGYSYASDSKIYSNAAILFASVSSEKLLVKAKGIWGQNLTDYTMLGGYAVSEIDETTGNETYVNSSSASSWLNVVYGKDFKVSLFGAYTKNLGFEENILESGGIYSRAADTDYMSRFSLSLIKNWKNLDCGLEYDITTANYGDIDYADKGKVINGSNISNSRVTFSFTYHFNKKIM